MTPHADTLRNSAAPIALDRAAVAVKRLVLPIAPDGTVTLPAALAKWQGMTFHYTPGVPVGVAIVTRTTDLSDPVGTIKGLGK